jgi:hypothetical protein
LAEGFDRVVGLAGAEAVVELAEHAVEQVSQGGGVSIAVGGAVAFCEVRAGIIVNPT